MTTIKIKHVFKSEKAKLILSTFELPLLSVVISLHRRFLNIAGLSSEVEWEK